MERHRLEDLGKLSILLLELYNDNMFEFKLSSHPENSWIAFTNLDEDQQKYFITDIVYMISNFRDKVGRCLDISEGKELK